MKFAYRKSSLPEEPTAKLVPCSDEFAVMPPHERAAFIYQNILDLNAVPVNGVSTIDIESLIFPKSKDHVKPDIFALDGSKSRLDQMKARFRTGIIPGFIDPGNPMVKMYPAEIYIGNSKRKMLDVTDKFYGIQFNVKNAKIPGFEEAMKHIPGFADAYKRNMVMCDSKYWISQIPMDTFKVAAISKTINVPETSKILKLFRKTRKITTSAIEVNMKVLVNVSKRKPSCMIYKHSPAFLNTNQFWEMSHLVNPVNVLLVVGGFEYYEYNRELGVTYPELMYPTILAASQI